MDQDLLSFISKLPTYSEPIKHYGRKVDDAVDQIAKRLPTLAIEKQKALGIFMQHMNIPSFTNAELLAAANKRIDLLISNTNEHLPTYIDEEQGFFDTGSYQINKRLSSLGLSSNQINFMLSRLSRNPSYIRRVMEG
jgi:hypothetical protein